MSIAPVARPTPPTTKSQPAPPFDRNELALEILRIKLASNPFPTAIDLLARECFKLADAMLAEAKRIA